MTGLLHGVKAEGGLAVPLLVGDDEGVLARVARAHLQDVQAELGPGRGQAVLHGLLFHLAAVLNSELHYRTFILEK